MYAYACRCDVQKSAFVIKIGLVVYVNPVANAFRNRLHRNTDVQVTILQLALLLRILHGLIWKEVHGG